jgi:hypothetical protein
LRAFYAGDGTYNTSTSAPLTQTVNSLPTTSLQTLGPFSTGLSPRYFAVADLNGDGKPDIVTPNGSDLYGHNVSVLLGKGDGTFQPAVNYSIGSNASTVVVADLNSDGKLDLVVQGNNSTINTLLGNGDGTFQPAVSVPLAGTFNTMVAADFNGDGRLDMLVSGFNGAVVLFGNGDGTFQTGPAPTFTGIFIAVGDVNGDGKPDVAVMTSNPGVVTVELGNGDGTFHAGSTYPVTATLSQGVTIADVNGDGRPDIIATAYNDNSVGVLLGNGDGTFQAVTSYPVGKNPQGVAVADLNGDGKADLAVANVLGQSISILNGNGDGTFQSAQTYQANLGSLTPVVADFNNDGRADIAVSNSLQFQLSAITIFLGHFSATSATTLTSSPNPSTYGQSVTLTANVTSSAGAPTGTVLFQDGVYVLGSAQLVNGKATLFTSLRNTGARSLTAVYGGDHSYAASVSAVLTQTVNAVSETGLQFPLIYTTTPPNGLAVGDFNGDGIADLAIASQASSPPGTVTIMLGNGDGSFHPPVNYPVGGSPSSLAIGDFNGDGNADLVVANGFGNASLLLGKGDGTFQPAVTLSIGANYFAVADFNGDGKADLAALGNGVNILLGNGNGTFQSPINFSTGTGAAIVAVGDFNRDGKADLAVANSQSNNVSILLGNGNGTFQSAVNYTVGTYPVALAVVDANGDGKPDLVVVNNGSSNYSVLLGAGDGTFQAIGNFGTGPSPTSIAVADFNGDGKPDLAINDPQNLSVDIYYGKGNGTFQNAGSYIAAINPLYIVAADFNGDGRADIAVSSNVSNLGIDPSYSGVNILLGIGQLAASTVSLTSSANPSTYGKNVTFTASISGNSGAATGRVTFYDGTTVLGIRTLSGGQASFTTSLLPSGVRAIRAYYGGNGAYSPASNSVQQNVNAVPSNGFQTAVPYPAGNYPEFVAAGDFNNDGIPDLAATSYLSNNISVLLGNGNGTFRAAVYSPANQPKTIAVADLNGDGNSDIAITDASNGSLGILLGNGDGTFQTEVVYSIPGMHVIAADFNGDGKVDLAVATGQRVSVLLGNGDGTFLQGLNFSAGIQPVYLAVGDFNGDKIPDLVAADYSASRICLLIGNGDGTFQPAVNFSTAANPSAIAVGDFNGDGKLDLAVAGSGIGVLLGNGDGTFQPAVPYAPGSTLETLTSGDVNADGRIDLISDGLILYGNGDGTFQNSVNFGANSPKAALLADFNGDGRTDLATVNRVANNLNIFFGDVATRLAFTTQPVTGAIGQALLPVRVQVQDASGNPMTGSASVTLTSNPAGINTTAAAVNGVATFSNLVLNTLGTYTLTASSTGIGSVGSTTFNIVTSLPRVAIDSPAPGAMLSSGSFTISGWALDDNSAISSVIVSVDGALVGTANYGINRNDVCAAYPGRPGCPNVGYSLALNLSVGTHTITVSATDSDAMPDAGLNTITVNVNAAPSASKVGVFRGGASFLLDSNGNEAYDPGVDRFIANFTGPGGFITGDVPVAGDWTGDGHAKVGIYRAATGTWYLDANNNGVLDANDLQYQFGGLSGDFPVVGDWNGLGKSCVGVFRSGFFWVLDLNCNGSYDGADAAFPFGGVGGDVPVVGAWTGTTTRVGVVRKYAPAGVPQGNPFYWVLDASPANAGSAPANHQPGYTFAFGGLAGDVFITGDWNGAGVSAAGVYRTGLWVLDAALPAAPQASHVVGQSFGYGGVQTDVPVVGKW